MEVLSSSLFCCVCLPCPPPSASACSGFFVPFLAFQRVRHGARTPTTLAAFPASEDTEGLRRGPVSAPDQVGQAPVALPSPGNAALAANSNTKIGVKVRDRPSHSWRSFPFKGNRERQTDRVQLQRCFFKRRHRCGDDDESLSIVERLTFETFH